MTDLKNTILKYVFLVGLLVSPFVYNPFVAIPYELPKVLFIKIWIEVLFVLGIFFVKKNDFWKNKDKGLIYLTLSFIAIAITTSLTGANFEKSWLGNYYRNDGLFTFLHFVGLTFFLNLFFKEDWIDWFYKIIATTGIVLSIFSVVTWVLINIFGKYEIETWIDGGIGLMFGNPNFLVGYLLVCLPPVAYLLKNLSVFRLKILRLIMWSLMIGAILLTKAWVGVFGIGIFLLCLTLFGKGQIKKRLLFTIGIVGVVLIFIINRNLLQKEFGNFILSESTSIPGQLIAESRQRIYMKGLLAFIKKPLVGYGWANFDRAFDSVDYPIHYQNDVYVDKAHSSILEVGTTTGISGLLIYLLIIGKTLINFRKSKNAYSFYFLILFTMLVIHMQTNIVSVSEEVIFWILVGIASAGSIGITPERVA